MATTFVSLWRWDGKVNRGTYALIGIFGLAIKHNLDRFIAYKFGFRWGISTYFDPLDRAVQFSPFSASEKEFLAILLITALPFIWIGITMSVKRLRDQDQPLWLTLLFFAPIINLLFFGVLTALPSRQADSPSSVGGGRASSLSPYWPTTRTGSAAVAVLMATPLAWLLAMFGGLLAMLIHRRANSPESAPSMFAVLLVSLPILFGAEHVAPPPVPRFQVHTTIEIAAPPEVVWKRLIAFPPLPVATEWPFRLGISYPIEARITGEGLSADRECRFSTGSFKEPILAWEPGKHFAFSVSDEPLLMKETSPYENIHVRHLEDHDFQPERADFVLVRLSNGGTRLEGTTTYQNKMWPSQYWRLWTDPIIHSIHNRVFRHVKKLAEADALRTSS